MKTLARANGMEPTASGASSPYKICTKTEKAKLTRMNCVEGEHWWLEIGHPDQATNKVSWKIYTEPSFFGQVKLLLLIVLTYPRTLSKRHKHVSMLTIF